MAMRTAKDYAEVSPGRWKPKDTSGPGKLKVSARKPVGR